MILDIILLLPIIYGLIRGIFRGLVGELTAIVAVVIGVLLAKVFAPDLASVFVKNVNWNESICLLLSYVLIFMVATLSLHGIGYLLKRFLKAISLGWLNGGLGGLFGALKWALVVSVLINCFDMLDNTFHILKPETKDASYVYKPLQKVASVTWDTVEQLERSNV